MAVPGFVRGAAAMQWQVGGGDDEGGLGLMFPYRAGAGLTAALPCGVVLRNTARPAGFAGTAIIPMLGWEV